MSSEQTPQQVKLSKNSRKLQSPPPQTTRTACPHNGSKKEVVGGMRCCGIAPRPSVTKRKERTRRSAKHHDLFRRGVAGQPRIHKHPRQVVVTLPHGAASETPSAHAASATWRPSSPAPPANAARPTTPAPSQAAATIRLRAAYEAAEARKRARTLHRLDSVAKGSK